MSALTLTVKLDSGEVPVGGSLAVELAFENRGSVALEVPGPDDPGDFEYRVQPVEPAGDVLLLSAVRAHGQRTGEVRPPSLIPKVPLAPGARATYRDDVARYATSPLPPGKYTLQATYAGYASPEVPFAVVLPRVGRLVTVVGSTGVLAGLFSRLTDQGGAELQQLESKAGSAPADAVAYRRFEVKPAEALEGLALAYDVKRAPGARWFAWLEGGQLGAAIAGGASLFVRIEPLALGLPGASLAPVGWQLGPNQALFAALGRDAQDQPALALVSFDAVKRAGRVQTVQLEALPALPQRWAAQLLLVQAAGDGGEAAPAPAAAGETLRLVLAGDREDRVRLTAMTVKLDPGVADPPVELLERPGPLAALGLAPVAGEGPASVDVLCGPTGEEGLMTLVRLPLAGGEPLLEASFPAPADQEKRRPVQWAIAPAPGPEPVALTRMGGQVLVCRTEKPGCALLADGQSDPQNLGLELVPQGLVALWTDPGAGMMVKPVP